MTIRTQLTAVGGGWADTENHNQVLRGEQIPSSREWGLGRKPITTLGMSLALGLATLLVPSVSVHASTVCRIVQGDLDETSIFTSEPAGRVVGNASGAIVGAETGIRTTQAFDPGTGTILITTLNSFVPAPGDMLVATGVGVFRPTSPTDVTGTITLTVDPTSSSGQFAGATGTITLEGGAHNVLGPSAGPGATTFAFHYKGRLCTP